MVNCEFCGGDFEKRDVMYLVPMPDGSRDTFTHRECAVRNGVYCETHDVRHSLFSTGGTACLRCIEDLVQENKPQAERIYQQISVHLPVSEVKEIEEWTELVKAFTNDESTAVCVLRSIMTEAKRRGIPPEKVIEEIIRSRSADLILPAFICV